MVNVKSLILGIGIVVVFALVLWQGIEAFYPSPQYDKFCSSSRFTEPTNIYPYGQQNCSFSTELEKMQQECYAQEGQPIFEYDSKGCAIALKECDFCNKKFNEEQMAHTQVVFFISLIVGIIAVIVGYAILSAEPVGSALIGSGIWSFFYGAVVNWKNFSNIWRFLMLLVALILLIWIALRLNKKKSFRFK